MLHAVFVIRLRLQLRRERGAHEGQEVRGDERGQRRHGLLVPDTHFTLCKGRSPCGFYLFGNPFVALLRALPDLLAIPGELEPPIPALGLLVDRHHLPPFFAAFCFANCFFPVPFGRPPSLPFSRAISCKRSMPKRSSLAL